MISLEIFRYVKWLTWRGYQNDWGIRMIGKPDSLPIVSTCANSDRLRTKLFLIQIVR